ncbi:hypothetical protein D9M69_590950 [compost metagenome]
MPHPLLQHHRQRLQTRLRTVHGERETVRELALDLVREVEHEVETSVARSTAQVAYGVVITQHLDLHLGNGRAALHEQSAHRTEAAGLIEHVQHLAVTTEHAPVLHPHALAAKQHLGRAPLPGIVNTLEQVAHHGLHHQIEEQRRDLDRAGLEEAGVCGLQ